MAPGKVDRDNGIVIGIVDDLEDTEKLGRVRVKIPHLGDTVSDWAYLVTPMAGKDRGLFLRPEKGDQVLVAYAQGDPRFAYILGSMWSKSDSPPPDDGKPADNNWRFIKSRSGHIVRLDDTSSKEKIEILDKSGSLKITLDSANKKIQITNDSGDIEVSSSSGNVSVSSSSGEVKVSGMTVEVHAQTSLTLKSSGTLTIQGMTVNINPPG
jgi:uncharacterized protein involved in type VI secretion and phage assembly